VNGSGRTLALALGGLAVVTLVGVALRRRWIVVTVFGASMLPALHHGDVVLGRRRAASRIRRADVVVLRAPGRPDDLLVKRVAAVAGDPVPDGVPATAAVVAAGHVVVIGDNGGLDSRAFGPVPHDLLLAVVVRRLRVARETTEIEDPDVTAVRSENP
jgi:signal peptidase I